MSTFVFFGNYSTDAFKGISSERTGKSKELAKKFGGEVKNVYALLGKDDLLLIADFPGSPEAVKFSVALTRLTGIGFSTSPALEAGEFDKLMEEL